MSEYVQLDEDTFDTIFRPVMTSSGGDNWDQTEIFEAGIPDCRVWTIVEGDSGALWCLPGWHTVNRFGYVVTAVSWIDSNMEALYMEASVCCEECGAPQDSMSIDEWCDECGRCMECCLVPGHGDCNEIFYIDTGGYISEVACDLKKGHDGECENA